jgi:hypothetical protein
MKYLRQYEKISKELVLNMYDLCVVFGSMDIVIKYLKKLKKNSTSYRVKRYSTYEEPNFDECDPITDEFATSPKNSEAIFISGIGHMSYGFIIEKKVSDVIFIFDNVEYDEKKFALLMSMNKYNI